MNHVSQELHRYACRIDSGHRHHAFPIEISDQPSFTNFALSNILMSMPKRTAPEEELQSESLRRFKADVFQVLGHPTRIHIAECLRETELSVSQLLDRIPVEPANLSQHLALLRSKGLVVNRKNGNQVFYRLRDPLLSEVLDAMKKYFQVHQREALAILQGLGE